MEYPFGIKAPVTAFLIAMGVENRYRQQQQQEEEQRVADQQERNDLIRSLRQEIRNLKSIDVEPKESTSSSNNKSKSICDAVSLMGTDYDNKLCVNYAIKMFEHSLQFKGYDTFIRMWNDVSYRDEMWKLHMAYLCTMYGYKSLLKRQDVDIWVNTMKKRSIGSNFTMSEIIELFGEYNHAIHNIINSPLTRNNDLCWELVSISREYPLSKDAKKYFVVKA